MPRLSQRLWRRRSEVDDKERQVMTSDLSCAQQLGDGHEYVGRVDEHHVGRRPHVDPAVGGARVDEAQMNPSGHSDPVFEASGRTRSRDTGDVGLNDA